MDIIWNQNPLLTKIILDNKDKEILKLKVRISLLEDVLSAAEYLKEKNVYDRIECPNLDMNGKTYLELAKDGLLISNKNFDEDVEYFYKMYLDELESGAHMGDCTAFPGTCIKCVAEDHLGINTISGISKRGAQYILNAFRENDTIEDLIVKLEETISYYKDDEKSTEYVLNWTKQLETALEWIKEYIKKRN